MVVPKGYSYYIDSFNNYHLQAIIPLSPFNYRVEVLFPVVDIQEQVVEIPKISVVDVADWLLSVRDYILDENHILYNITTMLIELGSRTIDYGLCGGDLEYKRAVALYVGHHLEFHFKDLKDEQYVMSLQHEIDDTKETKEKEIKVSYDSYMGEYKKTIYGRQLWTIYGQKAKFTIGYMPL